MKEFHTLVFIGRFQPLHKGHEAVIKQAMEQAEQVMIIVGSAHSPRNTRNPFTFEERKRMIKAVFPQPEVVVLPVSDYPSDHKWVAAVQSLVSSNMKHTPDPQKWIAAVQTLVSSNMKHTPDPYRIGLIGHSKDHTSFYLNMFPLWDSVDVANYKGLNSTDIRKDIFNQKDNTIISHMSNEARRIMMDSVNADCRVWWDMLLREHQIIEESKAAWKDAPYPVQFMTVDAVVVQSGHVLLVKRKSAPGIGQWALPGGFLNSNERIIDGVFRELKEETKIKVPEKVLRGSIKDSHVFDNPNRSTRGRTVTFAYYIDLGFDEKLPKVTGTDDAEKAVWVPFNKILQEKMFEDHAMIIDHFCTIF